MRRYNLYEIQMMTCHIMAKMETNTICLFEWDMFQSALDTIQKDFEFYSFDEKAEINELLEEFDRNLTRLETRIDLHKKLSMPCSLN